MIKSRKVLAYEIDHLLAERRLACTGAIARTPGRPLDRLPDIVGVLESGPVFRLLLRCQELVWTLRRWFGKAPNFGKAPDLGEASGPQSGGPPRPVRPAFAGQHGFGPTPTRPALLIDLTNTANGRVQGGIRVVSKDLATTAVTSGAALPIVVEGGVARPYFQNLPFPDEIAIGAGDTVVVIDDFWDAFLDYGDVLADARRRGARVAACIHDLIPLDYPALVPSYLPAAMAAGLPAAIAGSDVIVSVSQSSAQDVARYLHEKGLVPNQPVRWFRLGLRPHLKAGGSVREDFRRLFEGGETFLHVASLMPHKAHSVALAAFERCWARGGAQRYLLIGMLINGMPAVEAIRRHPQFGEKLVWIEDASDAEVLYAYRHARALVQPSIAEGFGLPMIEAASCGLPIIASDLPVFREIAGGDVRFVEPCDPEALAAAIEHPPAASAPVPFKSWQDTLAQLAAAVQMNVQIT